MLEFIAETLSASSKVPTMGKTLKRDHLVIPSSKSGLEIVEAEERSEPITLLP